MTIKHKTAVLAVAAMFAFMGVPAGVALAADDASIPADVKEKARAAMDHYIKQEIEVKGTFLLNDPVENKILNLKYDKVHKGMVKFKDGFLACADFTQGKVPYDIDFLVKIVGGQYRVVQAAVHAIDGKKRTGHMER